MDQLKHILLTKVFPVVLLVSVAAGISGYWHEQKTAEKNSIYILSMEAKRALTTDILLLPEKQRQVAFQHALRSMVGGMFSRATIYSYKHEMIADAIEPAFERYRPHIESAPHPDIADEAKNDSIDILDQKVLRVFVPLGTRETGLIGHLEGVRFVSDNERSAIKHAALVSSAIAALSVLICAIVLVPLLVFAANYNFQLIEILRTSQLEVLEVVGRAIAKRDSDTGIHNYRVTWMAARLGEKIGLTLDEMRGLIAGSFLHDIGKIGIPDQILLKPGKLTDWERGVIQSHVDIGIAIMGDAHFFRHAREVIAGHHEKWNGTGYPSMAKGELIPLNARIFAVVDVYDALRAKRPYKKSFGMNESLKIMHDGRGSHFDPTLFDVFLTIVDEIEQKMILSSESDTIILMREIARKYA